MNERRGRFAARRRRFAEYAWASFEQEREQEQEQELASAWTTVEKSAASENALITLFSVFPDAPDVQPFQGVYGRRRRNASEEKAAYLELREHVAALVEFLTAFDDTRSIPRGRVLQLLADCEDGPAADAAREFRKHLPGVSETLAWLRPLMEALDQADPSAKYLTAHAGSPDAARKSYTVQLACLNRYLVTPQHTALATLARVNCPACPVNAEALRKAWTRGADKRA